ncbi:MAG: hypothetical protein ACFFCD_14115 [Promethearchaeota archaeon]
MSLLEKLHNVVLNSKIAESLTVLKQVWENDPDPRKILEALHPISLFTFSHRFSTIHVPKEHEYLLRFLSQVPKHEQLDFIERFVEYLAWSPKYVNDVTNSFSSSGVKLNDYIGEYLSAMESRKGLEALFCALEVVEEKGIEEIFKTILRVGCNDISQAIGHYFSCTESVVRLGLTAGLPSAKNHIFLLTNYLMQSSPIALGTSQKPTLNLDELLHKLAKKGGFVGYHYLIVANGLIKNKEFLGEKYYLHALQGLEAMLSRLSDTLSTEKLDSIIIETPKTEDLIKELKKFIWKGEKAKAFSVLRSYLKEEDVTQELTNAIAHTYTKIDDHPHDPHYVTFPVAAFELVPHLKSEDVELVLAHSVEFVVNRVRNYGVLP